VKDLERLLETHVPPVRDAGDWERVWSNYDDVVVSCKGCHQAENVPFVNDQAMFRFHLVR
jgi:hypothetical protein